MPLAGFARECWLFSLLVTQLGFKAGAFIVNTPSSSSVLLDKIREDVRNQSDSVDAIIQHLVNGSGRGQIYNRLAEFVDTYDNRISGSQNLENAIDYVLQKLKDDGLENVHGEDVMVPKWVRGEESAFMIKPRQKQLAMLGVGYSVGTPSSGIQAEAIVIETFDELEKRAAEANGKIVVFNHPWDNYTSSRGYRAYGASRAAAVGAVAILVRSLTPFSIYSLHAGAQIYNDSVPKIPAACITVEDASMLDRIAKRGVTIEIFLNMSAQMLPESLSRNVVAEIKGSVYPEQVVLIGGHIDTWDIGQGAMDDGAGSFLGWQALSTLKQLGMRPKRTIRAIMWTSEEFVYVGARGYYESHKNHTNDFVFAMESDSGTFKPRGLSFAGNAEAKLIMADVMAPLSKIDATALKLFPIDKAFGGENSYWHARGIPGALLDTHDETYYYFHHSAGDTMDIINSDDLDLCTALWTSVAYTIANIESVMPRDIVPEGTVYLEF